MKKRRYRLAGNRTGNFAQHPKLQAHCRWPHRRAEQRQPAGPRRLTHRCISRQAHETNACRPLHGLLSIHRPGRLARHMSPHPAILGLSDRSRMPLSARSSAGTYLILGGKRALRRFPSCCLVRCPNSHINSGLSCGHDVRSCRCERTWRRGRSSWGVGVTEVMSKPSFPAAFFDCRPSADRALPDLRSLSKRVCGRSPEGPGRPLGTLGCTASRRRPDSSLDAVDVVSVR